MWQPDDNFVNLKQHTLSGLERLKSRKQIDRLFSDGKYFNLPPVRVIYSIDPMNENNALQLGVGVSGKFFRKAVDRNRVKRLIRESWRLQKIELANLAAQKNLSLKVFIIYTGRELPQYSLVFDKIGMAIEQLRSRLHEQDPANT